MPIIVELKENRPGYADIEIKRWKGDTEIEIAIQRNQDQHYFAQGMQWNPEPVWHRLTNLVNTGESLQGILEPWIIDALVQQGVNAQYLLFAKSDGLTDRGVIRFVGNILASSAGGDSFRGEDIRDIVTQEVEPTVTKVEETEIVQPEAIEPRSEPIVEAPIAPSVVDTVVEPIIAPPAPKKKSPLIWILLLLLLICVGAAVWWFLFKGKSEPEQPSTNQSVCEVKAGEDELAFIQACLKTNPDTKQLLQVIENAKKMNACGVAQRLYANKAQGGNAEIAFAYAKEYDSAFSKGEGCFKLDKETALYWYETGLVADPNNTEAKKRIEELKK